MYIHIYILYVYIYIYIYMHIIACVGYVLNLWGFFYGGWGGAKEIAVEFFSSLSVTTTHLLD